MSNRNRDNREKLLPHVQRPTRYTNSEWNAHHAYGEHKTGICLCFPDLYEVGSSNLGLQILYHLINAIPDAYAERCFCPADDYRALLKERNVALHSIESAIPLRDFDLVGFTLQFELCGTNILTMLDAADIPFYQCDRTDEHPLIVGGGPVSCNPEPYAEFFDLFVIGDGEGALPRIMEMVRAEKAKGTSRRDILVQLAQIPGVYVPSLYTVTYHDDGTVERVAPMSDAVPATINRERVDINTVPYPTKQLVPFMDTVHNRLNIEIARGCPARCRFCQATKYYWPWRQRSADEVVRLTSEGLAATGYEDVSFSSLSCTSHQELGDIIKRVNSAHGSKRVSVSLPSLRCDQFSVSVASGLGYGKRTSLTFAPEAGTERMRAVIGKDLTEKQIVDTLALAYANGWRQVKLYFMVGLPHETHKDIEGIGRLIAAIRRQAPLNFGITLSPFVPKAHTPFQWVAMEDPVSLEEKLGLLKKSLRGAVKGFQCDSSVLEAVFARGDRRLAKVIEHAWKAGCRFDQWREHLRLDVWKQSFEEMKIDMSFYSFRVRQRDEVFPWEHIIMPGGAKDTLWREYEKSQEYAALPIESEAYVPEKEFKALPAPKPLQSPAPVRRFRMRFSRGPEVRFVSHLEQIDFFRRVMRRAGLPLAFTSGYHPQPKMSFGPAISVGYESGAEYVEVELVRAMSAGDAQQRVERVLPKGYELISVRQVPVFFPAVDALTNIAEFEIYYPVTEEQRNTLLAEKEIIIEKVKKRGTQRIDVRPLVHELYAIEGGMGMKMYFGPKKTIKPEKVLQWMTGLSDDAVKDVRIVRTSLFIQKADGTVTTP